MTIHGSGMAAAVAGTAGTTIVAMSYTSSELLLIIAAVGTLVTIIGGQIVTIIVTVQARKELSKKVDENTAVTTTVAEKTASIEHATNSAATKAEEIITALRQQIKYQDRNAAEDRERATLLAQAAAIAVAHQPGAVVVNGPTVAPLADESLKKIETNTGETAKNTTRTEAAVKDLKSTD